MKIKLQSIFRAIFIALGLTLTLSLTTYAQDVFESDFFKTEQQVKQPEKKMPLIAVLDIRDNSGKLESFAFGLPDMLITELIRSGKFKVVERSRIQEAVRSLELEKSGLTKESKIQLGQWLGADQLLFGVLNEAGGLYRLDVRLIDVTTGAVKNAATVTRPAESLLEMISVVSKRLSASVIRKENPTPKAEPKATMPVKNWHQRPLQVRFKIRVSPLRQDPYPMQMVRLYQDNKMIAESKPIKKFGEEIVLFDLSIPIKNGSLLQFKHGAINKKGQWAKALNLEVAEFILDHENTPLCIDYKLSLKTFGEELSPVRYCD